MADTIFCLDIHEDRVAAVNIENSTGAIVVTGCASSEMGNSPFSEVLQSLIEETGFQSGSCRVSLGAEHFSYRNLSLPFKDRNKIDQILPFELDDKSPFDIDTLAIDFVVTGGSDEGSSILAAMIDKEVLTDCLATLLGLGVDPDTVGISGIQQALYLIDDQESDFIFLDIGSKWATLILVRQSNISLIRSIPAPVPTFGDEGEPVFTEFVQAMHQTLLIAGFIDTNTEACTLFVSAPYATFHGISYDFAKRVENANVKRFDLNVQPRVKVVQEISDSYRPETMDSALSLAFRGNLRQSGFNFRKGALKKKKSFAEYRKTLLKFAVPACVLIVCGLGYWIYSFSELRTQQDELNRQITDVFKKTLPGITRIVNPVQQLTVKNKEIMDTYRPGGLSGTELTVIDILAEISSRISPDRPVKVVRLVADMEVVRIKGETEDFNTVDVVQKELEKSPYFKNVSISSANQSLRGDEVSFELKLERTL